MKRFLNPITGGLPYVNTDFSDIYQTSHIKSYSAMLDSMLENDNNQGDNIGIVLSGCKINSADGSFFTMSFTNSVVYIDGEYYQNHPSHGISTIKLADPFYIIPGPTISETRLLRDLTTVATVSVTRYITFSTSPPTEPHIQFSNKGTSRYFKRLVKYFTSREEDIYMTNTFSNFDMNDGYGFNDMYGFKLLHYDIPGQPNLSNKFLMGESGNYSIGNTGGTSSIRLKHDDISGHIHTILGVSAGATAMNHYHGINTGHSRPDSDIVGYVEMQDSVPGDLNVTESGDPVNVLIKDGRNLPKGFNPYLPYPGDTNNNIGSLFGVGPLIESDGSGYLQFGYALFTGGIHDYENSELGKHTHGVPTAFGGGVPTQSAQTQPHENRPPYYVVAYYTKI